MIDQSNGNGSQMRHIFRREGWEVAVAPDLAFNTSVSFITNTNWQNYSGETTMSHLTQMIGLTVHNFLSAATGLAMAFALLDPSVSTVLFGATRPEQVSANLGALALADRLPPQERDRLAAIGVP